MLRVSTRDFKLKGDSVLEYFAERNSTNYKIIDKNFLVSNNCFSLYEGASKDPSEKNQKIKKVFIIELYYVDKENLNNQQNKKQFEFSTKNVLEVNDNCLKRIGFDYNEEKNIFSIVYEKESKEYINLKNKTCNSRLLTLYYFLSLLKTVKTFHINYNISFGLIHPDLLFLDSASHQLYTVDNIFFGIVQLVNKTKNIDILNYYGYLKLDKLDSICNSYPIQNKVLNIPQLHYKCDIILLCILLKWLFSKKTYDYELFDLFQQINNESEINYAIENDKKLSNIIKDTLNYENGFIFEKIKDVSYLITKIEGMVNKELKDDKLNVNMPFVCLNCGMKLLKNHMCKSLEMKENKNNEKIIKELIEKVNNIPVIQATQLNLYEKIEEIDSNLFIKINKVNQDILLYIKKEETKFNEIINYINDLLLKTKAVKIEKINEECEKTKKILNETIIVFENINKTDKLKDISEKNLQNILEKVRIAFESFQDFVLNSQKSLNHFNFDEKLNDIIIEMKNEYLSFIDSINKHYSFYLDTTNQYISTLNIYVELLKNTIPYNEIKKENNQFETLANKLQFAKLQDNSSCTMIKQQTLIVKSNQLLASTKDLLKEEVKSN